MGGKKLTIPLLKRNSALWTEKYEKELHLKVKFLGTKGNLHYLK